MTTTTVPSPVHYVQYGDGFIRTADGLALVPETATHTLIARLMESARITARATGSIGATHVETILGVEIRAEWLRERPAPVEDDEPEPDIEFSLDAVVAALHERGIPGHVDMTGGGHATIYAGGKHVVLDGSEERVDWDVAAGPGTYSYTADSTALLAEFYVGPNDEGFSETTSLPDTILASAEAVAWAVDAIQRAVIETETRSFAEWNRRTCLHCKGILVPGPRGAWVALDLSVCTVAVDGVHGTY